MRIAFDLRYASDHFPGIGTHAAALLHALLALPEDDAFEVLWDPTVPAARCEFETLRRHPKVRWSELEAPALGATGARRVGGWLRGIAPEVYVSPYFMRPWRPGCPTVLTLHDVLGFDRPQGYSRLRLLAMRLLVSMSRSSHWMTSSEFSRDRIRRHTGIPKGRLHLVRPGVPPSVFSGEAHRPEKAPAGRFALAVGINKPHKNLETLVRAWANFGEPPLELVCVGPIDRRYPDAAALATLHGASRITALGAVSDEELRWLYRNATLFVFPSLYEGFGFPLLEAMASGVAAIASDIPALRELGGDAPLWVPARDSEAWSQAVQSLSRDDASRADRARAGRARAHMFDYADTARKARAVFELAGRTL